MRQQHQATIDAIVRYHTGALKYINGYGHASVVRYQRTGICDACGHVDEDILTINTAQINICHACLRESTGAQCHPHTLEIRPLKPSHGGIQAHANDAAKSLASITWFATLKRLNPSWRGRCEICMRRQYTTLSQIHTYADVYGARHNICLGCYAENLQRTTHIFGKCMIVREVFSCMYNDVAKVLLCEYVAVCTAQFE